MKLSCLIKFSLKNKTSKLIKALLAIFIPEQTKMSQEERLYIKFMFILVYCLI